MKPKKKPDSPTSVYDLPTANQIVRPTLQNNEILQLCNTSGNIHAFDREKASVLNDNMKQNRRISKTHPYFNRTMLSEPEVKLSAADLFQLGQISEQ